VISDVEQMQTNIRNGKTAKSRGSGRGGKTTGGAGAASRAVATIQSILGHAAQRDCLQSE
jgi:hypothetical protein